jgi:Zn-dependent protease with chaperone function
VSVYSLGYQQGVIDCTKEPEQLQERILHSILRSTGAVRLDDVEIVNETDISFFSKSTHHQVAAVGHRIISTARGYVEQKLEQAMTAVESKLPPDVAPKVALQTMEDDDDVKFWYGARLRLQGENVQNTPWKYVFIDSPHPNAFVTEILPQHVFITTSILKLAETPDELAVVLGHEISHLILGHVSEKNMTETFLRTAEVLLLSMDPTVGVLSLFVITGLWSLRQMISAAHSREHETEADDLGLSLAARACFDTVAGCDVMRKMHVAGLGPTPTDVVKSDESSRGRPSTALVRLLDSHPPSLDRYERMKKKAEDGENYTKYTDQQCANMSRRLFPRSLWGSNKEQ